MAEKPFLIGICDDEQQDLERIEEAARRNFETLLPHVRIECRLFGDGEVLYETCRKNPFDLLFLDIEMQGIDGFMLAERIAAERKNCGLVFVSRHENLVFDSWQYSPLWFVRKNMLERDMRLAVQKFIGLSVMSGDSCMFRGKDGRHLLPDDIMYLESRGHLLSIRTKDGGMFEQYGSLKASEEQLSASHFLRVHKSYLVNQAYIQEIGKREVLLTDGTCLEMGRDRRKELQAAMNRYRRDNHERH